MGTERNGLDMKRNGNGRAALLRGRVGRLVAGLVCCAGTVLAASPRLTYVGESNGVWTASGAWQNEAGETVDWVDGAVAVIGDTDVQIPEAGVTVEGLEYAPAGGKRYVRGAGRLTVGAAGITMANAVYAEVNLQPKGGLHLAADQTWTATAANGMLCFDGDVPLTAETGVRILVTGGKAVNVRVNARGRLGLDETVVVEAPSSVSPASGVGRGFGTPTLILSGTGTRVSFGAQYDTKEFGMNYASHLVLRDGADLWMNVYDGQTNGFGVPYVTVDGVATADGSRIRGAAGGVLTLTVFETVFDVAAGHRMTFEPCVVDAPGGAAGVVKRGAGTLAFAGTGTAFSGGVSVEEGTVEFTADATLAGAVSGTVSVAEGKTVRFGFASSGTFVKTGAGTAVLGWGDVGSDIHVVEGTVEVGGIPAPPQNGLSAWLDATAAASLTTNEAGVVSNWADRRGGTFSAVRHQEHQLPVWTAGALNGLPVLDFGRIAEKTIEGDDRMMAFSSARTGIRTVFWVIGSRNGGGFLLGDSQVVDGSKRHFHRGGDYGLTASAPLWGGDWQDKGVVRAGETWVNGEAVDGTETGLSGAYDLVGWRISETDDAAGKSAGATWLASCYAANKGDNYRLTGGQELGELLIYTNRLTDAERDAATAYLARKWFPQTAAAQTGPTFGTVTLEGEGATFHAGTAAHLGRLVVKSGCAFAGLGNLTVEELVFEEGATLRVVYGADGKVAAPFTGAARIVFPQTMKLEVVVPEGVAPVGTSVLAVASDAVTGVPVWTPAPGVSAVYRVVVDAASGKVSLAVLSGTLFILR